MKKLFQKILDLNSCWQSVGELVFRIILSVFIITHGWGKLSTFSERADVFPDPIGLGSFLSLTLATFTEFFCGILVLFGLFTRLASFSILITMLVAGLIFHSADPFHQKELSLLFAAGFFYFTLAGGNRYSLDQWLRKLWIK